MGKIFSLSLPYEAAILVVIILFLPFFLRNNRRNRYNQKRFSDVNIYMEQFLYSFEKSGKILDTLRDVGAVFEDGLMKKTIRSAIGHIEKTYEPQVERQALRRIEEEYGYEGLHRMHEFALQVEREGGEYRESAAILLEQRRLWADRTYEYLNEKRHQRNRVFMSIVSTLMLCSMIYIMSRNMNIASGSSALARIGTVIVLSLDILIFYLADRRLSQDDIMKIESDGAYEVSLEEKLKRIRGPLSGIRKRAIKKTITRRIEKDFPKWLIDMTLLLQNDTVQVAIQKSVAEAPLILKSHLNKMLASLKDDPTGIRPFMDFVSDYTLPEVRTSMKVLYSLSENGNGASSRELGEILKRNEKLMDKSNRLENEDRMSGMTMLFLAPQITGGMKLMIDLGLMFVTYMSSAGTLGL